jgi:D-serine deaminase-like pyridoxal phosphate-dependent protein
MAQPQPARPGDSIRDIDTPALIMEMEAFEANLALMAVEARRLGVALRPHAKSNKCAEIAARQIAAGAVGVCVQKVSEAVALAAEGIGDILICNELTSDRKIAALVELSGRIRVAACVDDLDNVAAIERLAARADTVVSLMIEVDVGQGRCGVAPGAAVVTLAQAIVAEPHLRFAGLHAYNGGAQHVRAVDERRARAEATVAQARIAVAALAGAGIACPVVSGAGTGTFAYEGGSTVYTEIQPGSYVFMDADYNRNQWRPEGSTPPGPPFRQSLYVLAGVVSGVSPGRAIVDAGLKALAVDSGMPVVADRPGVIYEKASDEHGTLLIGAGAARPAPGDVVKLIPGHCDPTVNLYDWLVVYRGARVEAVWPVSARGALG